MLLLVVQLTLNVHPALQEAETCYGVPHDQRALKKARKLCHLLRCIVLDNTWPRGRRAVQLLATRMRCCAVQMYGAGNTLP